MNIALTRIFIVKESFQMVAEKNMFVLASSDLLFDTMVHWYT